MLCVPPEVCRPVSVIFIQRLLHNPEGLGHLSNPLQLVRDIALPVLVEELRPPGGQLLVHLVHVGFPALCGDIQPSEVALSEVVEIRDTRRVLLGDLQRRVPQVVPQLLVLVVVFPVHDDALFVCLVEQPVYGLLGHPPLLQILLRQLPGDPFQVLPPRCPGHAQAVPQLVQQAPFRPLQIALYLPGQGVEVALLRLLSLLLLHRGQGIVRRLRRRVLVHAVADVLVVQSGEGEARDLRLRAALHGSVQVRDVGIVVLEHIRELRPGVFGVCLVEAPDKGVQLVKCSSHLFIR